MNLAPKIIFWKGMLMNTLKADQAMTNEEQKLREIVERWMGKKHPITMQSYVSDLTALISEHYYPKEFISWFRSEEFFDDFDEHIEDGNTYWVRVGFSLIYESIDELYQYYKENEQ